MQVQCLVDNENHYWSGLQSLELAESVPAFPLTTTMTSIDKGLVRLTDIQRSSLALPIDLPRHAITHATSGEGLRRAGDPARVVLVQKTVVKCGNVPRGPPSTSTHSSTSRKDHGRSGASRIFARSQILR
jgi:hypothetical protein